MEIEATFICAYCLQQNSIVIDSSGGKTQEYVEDCQICCKPNTLKIQIDDNLTSAQVYAEMA